MNKKELIDTVADEADLTKEAASAAVDAMLDSIVATLKSGDSVRIAGFGNFEVSQRKASTGRNPRTGEAIKIPAAMVPKFKAGKALKEAVNK
jgi:DNA-binding protein HU-beta